jgi:hypothetical protein
VLIRMLTVLARRSEIVDGSEAEDVDHLHVKAGANHVSLHFPL